MKYVFSIFQLQLPFISLMPSELKWSVILVRTPIFAMWVRAHNVHTVLDTALGAVLYLNYELPQQEFHGYRTFMILWLFLLRLTTMIIKSAETASVKPNTSYLLRTTKICQRKTGSCLTIPMAGLQETTFLWIVLQNLSASILIIHSHRSLTTTEHNSCLSQYLKSCL